MTLVGLKSNSGRFFIIKGQNQRDCWGGFRIYIKISIALDSLPRINKGAKKLPGISL